MADAGNERVGRDPARPSSKNGNVVDLEKENLQDQYPFWVDKRQRHEHLAKCCLQVLSENNVLREDLCGLKQPGRSRHDITQQTIDTHLPTHVQYACKYWVFHWKETERLIHDGDLVTKFLHQNLLHWVEALSLLGRINESIDMVQDLIGSLDVSILSYMFLFVIFLR